jgi:hypothetical protein
VKGGPTVQAQRHAGEPITPEVLHDISEGEKKISVEHFEGGPSEHGAERAGQQQEVDMEQSRTLDQ